MIHNYINWSCPNCGAPLILKAEWPIKVSKEDALAHSYEEIELIRHCPDCHLDWVNTYITEFGDETETQLERKFWG